MFVKWTTKRVSLLVVLKALVSTQTQCQTLDLHPVNKSLNREIDIVRTIVPKRKLRIRKVK